MKIAPTTDSFIVGQDGVSTVVAAQARCLHKRDHQLIVFLVGFPMRILTGGS